MDNDHTPLSDDDLASEAASERAHDLVAEPPEPDFPAPAPWWGSPPVEASVSEEPSVAEIGSDGEHEIPSYAPFIPAPADTLGLGEPGAVKTRNLERSRLLTAVGAGVAVCLLSGTAGAVIATKLDDKKTSTASPFTQAAPVSDTGTSATEQLAKVAAAVQPSTVSIKVVAGTGSDEGTGIVLKSDGTILTNNHVIEAAADGAGTITVKFSDGKSATATIVGRDPSVDLAVIKAANITGATAATLGSSSSLHVGDTVLAIGSPLGLEGSVSAGIVSALHRTVLLGGGTDQFGRSLGNTSSVGDAIQTDAAINPGNSGGPLVDNQGRVIGINTAIATVSGNSQSGSIGVGFAIPIDEAKSVVEALLAGKTPDRAVLGVQIADDPKGGALLRAVNSGSAADKAGLKADDVITKIDSSTVADGNELVAVLRGHRPGDTVTVYFTRSGKEMSVKVTLGAQAA